MKRFALFLSLCLLTNCAVAAQSDIHHYTLSNGLQLYVKPDKRANVVISQLWYKAGSADEQNGLTGLAHLLEHMMFKGTKKFPAGEFSKLIAANGGEQNAFTSTDYTVYYQKLAADRLPLAFELEADRMENLQFSEQEFKKEIEVVKEERRMRIDDNPQGVTYERFMAAAHLNAPYHHLTIGWMNDLNNIRLEDAKRWYDTWYVPNNAVLVVVGDVDAKKVHRLAQRYFGKIAKGKLPRRLNYQEPPALSRRDVSVRATAKLPLLILGFNSPSLKDTDNAKDVYALDVLSGVLSGNDTSRFSKQLIRGKQIAVSAQAGFDLYSRYPGLFTISAVPAKGTSIEQLRDELMAQVEQLQQQPINKDELRRIIIQTRANKIYGQDSLSGQAMQIGSLASNGFSVAEIENYLQQVQQLSAADLQQAAKRYLTKERLTIATLIPIAKRSQ